MDGKAGVWSKILSLRELLGTLGEPDVVVPDRARCCVVWLFPMLWCLVAESEGLGQKLFKYFEVTV